ncbi:MAG: metallophosphoesterase family protein [Oscillospiraceae bacterium]|nr:metallophosphoesterase family protein [Oscillospiraceae bacterium]
MKILLVSDEEDRFLWDYYTPGRLKGIDLILSAGDLDAEYLSFLVTMANRPLLYVHGNHDGGYAQRPPEGCQCIDGKLVTVGGLRILGLGGSALYNGGPHQYTERQMRWRIHRLRLKLALTGGVDIVLTHAPVRGFGDEDNMTHRGFEAFLPLLDQYQPRYLVHGHIHQRYGANRPRCYQYSETTIVNATGRYILEFPDKPGN